MYQYQRRSVFVRTCAVIPVYNNADTVADVVSRTLCHLPVIVVADGPTDGTLQVLQSIRDERLVIVSYPNNKGKGYALKTGLQKAAESGYTHALTLDADGQHYPEDIPLLLRMSAVRPEAIIVGSRVLQQDNMPRKNTFANRFSNFWFTVQTGLPLPDTQSGFRVYPLAHTHGIPLMTRRYEAELQLLVFSAWANTPVIPVPVRVWYPPQDQRVSFFRPARDFARISLLNTLLCCLALIYGLPRCQWRTVYYGLLFLLFALWTNIVRCFYSLFFPKKTSVVLRKSLKRGSRVFLNSFPGARFRVCYAPSAEPADGQPCVYIGNHTSLLDVLAVLSLDERIVLIGKEWVLHNIFFGRVAQAMGVIAAGEGIENMVPVIKQYTDRGFSVAVFPEGTRSLYGEIGRFHRGAFYLAQELHLPIRPLLLEGFVRALQKSPFHAGAESELRITVMPIVPPEDTSFGTTYQERTRMFRRYYKQLMDHSHND